MKTNIILIGMPGSGKSTIGPDLADQLGKKFIDTDSLIKKSVKMELRDFVAENGTGTFLKIQESCILGLKSENSVIATGGSVIYSSSSMEHLKENGIIVYLQLGVEELIKRLRPGRRFAKSRGQDYMGMYKERLPMYSRYSDIIVNCSEKDINQIIKEIIEKLKEIQ